MRKQQRATCTAADAVRVNPQMLGEFAGRPGPESA